MMTLWTRLSRNGVSLVLSLTSAIITSVERFMCVIVARVSLHRMLKILSQGGGIARIAAAK